MTLWHFTVRAERISNNRHRVTVTTASGKTFIREGWSPLWELIRIIGTRESNVNANAPTGETLQ